MMSTTARRCLSAGVASLLAAGALALGTSGARADVVGTMKVTPSTGSDTQGISLSTSAPCPEPATNLIVSVKGAGFPAEGQYVVGNSEIAIYNPTPDGGFEVPLTETMRDYASEAGFSTLQGRYDFTLTCRKAFGDATFGDFTTSIWFTSNTHYQDTLPQVATTTTLAASPAGPVVEGSAVKLTATVAPAGAAGTVRFLDGATQVGSPVNVTSGTASLSTSALKVGTHSLKAAFTPANSAAYGASTSAVKSFVVKIKPPALVTAAKVTGTARVASTVTCSVSFRGASTVTYAWLRDGKTYGGKTARTLVLAATDYKHKIACRPTAGNSTGKLTVTSPAVTVAVGPALQNATKPAISGTAKVGKRVTAKVGTWKPSGTSYSYVWRRDGHNIKGATHSTYVLTKSDRKHLVTVVVTARRTGYTNGTAVSKSVRVA
ncbi:MULTISPECIES: Ig-like domain-containing protein [unclassified Streptomyces]|uniref:Ig-like domain-containing protein n=1 Tax=unclassified Streptomyces TaxID=2593676 RepID=UPI0038155E8B